MYINNTYLTLSVFLTEELEITQLGKPVTDESQKQVKSGQSEILTSIAFWYKQASQTELKTLWQDLNVFSKYDEKVVCGRISKQI